MLDGINISRRRSHFIDEPKQELGSGFEFSEDKDALDSILNNKGISQAQRQAMNQVASHQNSFTPGKLTKEEGNFEFFQGQGGHIFFRKKTKCATIRKVAENDSLEVDRDNYDRSVGNSFKPVRFGSSKKVKKDCNSRKENDDPMSERKKKGVDMFVAPHRQSISERRPVRRRSQIPHYKEGARKGLKFDKGPNVFKKPFTPLADKNISKGCALKQNVEASKSDFHSLQLEPLRKLDRDSMKMLPRDSLAWINQLPRDSATFLELEKLMNDKDKDLLREDDTGSFEAMELRLKTPRKPVLVDMLSRSEKDVDDVSSADKGKQEEVEIDTECEENKDKVSEDSSDHDENTDDENGSPVRDRFKVMLTLTPVFSKKDERESIDSEVFTPKSDLLQGNLLDEFNKMPTNAKLATPAIKSQSMSDLTKDDEEPREVHKCVSDEIVSKDMQVSSLVSLDALHKAVKEMEELRKEQEELEIMQQQLFDKIRQRKQKFKEVWGVSPMRVQKTRTVIEKQQRYIEPKELATKQPTSVIIDEDITFNIPTLNNHDQPTDIKEYAILNTPSLVGLKPLAGTPATNKNGPDTSVLNTEMKKVRFNSGENKSKFLTPDTELLARSRIEENIADSSRDQNLTTHNVSSLSSDQDHENHPKIDQNQAKYSRRSFTNQSFLSMKSSFAFLQTPGGGSKSRQTAPVTNVTVASNSFKETNDQIKVGVPTPMALKSLSARVKEEYALLYADDEDDQDESDDDDEDDDCSHQHLTQLSKHSNDFIKKLNF